MGTWKEWQEFLNGERDEWTYGYGPTGQSNTNDDDDEDNEDLDNSMDYLNNH